MVTPSPGYSTVGKKQNAIDFLNSLESVRKTDLIKGLMLLMLSMANFPRLLQTQKFHCLLSNRQTTSTFLNKITNLSTTSQLLCLKLLCSQ